MSLQPCRRIGWLPRVLEALSIPSISPSMTVAGGAGAPVTFFSHMLPTTTRVDSPPWRIGEGSPCLLEFFFFAPLVCDKYIKVSAFRIPQSIPISSNPASASPSFTFVCSLLSFGLTEACVCHPHRSLCSVLHCISGKPNFGPSHIIVRTLFFQKDARTTQKEKNLPSAPIPTTTPTQHPGRRSTHNCPLLD